MANNRKVTEKTIGGIDFVLFVVPSTGPHLVTYGRGCSNSRQLTTRDGCNSLIVPKIAMIDLSGDKIV